MLYALGSPLSFVLLVVSFVLAVTLHGWVSSLAADRAGWREPAAEGRLRPDPRRHLDPFGAVAGAIAGFGWARPLEPPRRMGKARLVVTLLAGAFVNIALALLVLLALRLVYGAGLVDASAAVLQHGLDSGSDSLSNDLGFPWLLIHFGLLFSLMNLFVGLLALMPLPPLPGGRLLFALAPRSSGWQKAEHHLVERNIGLAVLLALLLIPLGGPQALLPVVVGTVADPLVGLVSGG
ncbi:MAG TPA: hypothetical protein VNA30_00510 [Mycobacteriales bacterium]|nr:hypothetical protein [Mycobacteriales bacterium]